jgi:menaquinone-specific isochorismate synthase
VAGAEAVLDFTASGRDRFVRCQEFVDRVLQDCIVVGDQTAAFAGPHFFTAFSFGDDVETGESFEPATVFVPRWQVALCQGRTTAVANLLVEPEVSVGPQVERIWRARKKFGSFDYGRPGFVAPGRPAKVDVQEVGSADHYETAVKTALREITEGKYRKIVLARAKDLTASTDFHPLQLLNGLRQQYADCFAFSVANGKGQSLIGASPERLVRVAKGEMATEALAGSAPRGDTASEDAALAAALQRSEKDVSEHAHVVDSIVNALNSLSIHSTVYRKPVVRRFANVQHLHTPITAPLPAGVRPLDVVSKLHPTPAVGGSPRDAALPRIRELEGFPRGLYAGALGWLNSRQEGEFFVGLRSALIDGSKARLYAGAGIVAGSEPAKERAETELKFAAMQPFFLLEPHR